ncbi:MAG: hypothetical protein EOO46_21930, partial [Flavobacterium sp.]
MKKTLQLTLLVLALHFQSISFSQEKNQSSWIIKANPIASVDVFSFPTIQFAVEKKLNDSFSVQTEMGYQFYDFDDTIDTTSVNVGGFKVNAEGRFYIFKYLKKEKSRKNNSDGFYTGIQVFHRENKYNAATSYFLNNTETILVKDHFGVIKKAYGLNLALGFQKQFRRFVMEPYLYIGIMKRIIKNRDREFNEDLGHV